MIERTLPGQCPQAPKTNEQRWAAVRPLYHALRNRERHERTRPDPR
jgi:hypothetical protein